MWSNAFRQLYFFYEDFYRYSHKLQAVGPLIFIGQGNYSGPEPKRIGSILIEPGESVGILHFNNRQLWAYNHAYPMRKAALLFRRQLATSLQQLAELTAGSEAFNQIKAFTGITWLPHHGEKFGFQSEPLPQTWRNLLLTLNFKVMLRVVFAGSHLQRRQQELRPRRFWLTHSRLAQLFSTAQRQVIDEGVGI